MPSALPREFIEAAAARGISESELTRQWGRLQGGLSHCTPHGPCQRGDGIQTISKEAMQRLAIRGSLLKAEQAVRLVPASGIASRMFKALASGSQEAIAQLDAQWEGFPFCKAAEATGPCETPTERLTAVMERLKLQDMPKGGLTFHTYPTESRTAFEEHMHEWKATLPDASTPIVHFTLPEQSREVWNERLERWAEQIGVKVSTSVQHHSTDTMGMGMDGRPFMDENGAPLFRPGGHGALLRNLSDLAKAHPGAFVSIKNIDNVRPTTSHGEVVPWRKALLGLAAELDEARKQAVAALDAGDSRPAELWLEGGITHPTDPRPQSIPALRTALERPLLVAGMVRNEGEPGGGPFWLRDDEGVLRAQIIESGEMDLDNPSIGNCMAEATHFNPVDLICLMHDTSGVPLDLTRFVDHRRDFLVSKSHKGKPLIGLEHPGLWNGAMGRWNTLFVEVPSRTFAPVKTVFDLLRPEHQA
jgi:hypothetical protein